MIRQFVWVVALAVLAWGCLPQQVQAQAAAADGLARAVNTATTKLVAEYDAGGEKILQAARSGLPKDEAIQQLEAHRSSWEPVWIAHEAFAQAHDAWATSLEGGPAFDRARLLAAYCLLRTVARAHAELPDVGCSP